MRLDTRFVKKGVFKVVTQAVCLMCMGMLMVTVSGPVQASPTAFQNEGSQFLEANKLFLKRNYADAAILYRRHLDQEPGHIRALFNLASCYEQMGDLKQALTFYQKALDQDQSLRDAQLKVFELKQQLPAEAPVQPPVVVQKDPVPDPATTQSETQPTTQNETQQVAKTDPVAIDPINQEPDNASHLADGEPIAKSNSERDQQPAVIAQEPSQTVPKQIETATQGSVLDYWPIALGIVILIGVIAVLMVTRRRNEGDVSGFIHQFPLPDLLQFLSHGEKTGVLNVIGDDTKGSIFFERGRIVGARHVFHQGQQALNDVMKVEKGRFTFVEKEQSEKTVDSMDLAVESFLMNWAYEIDEMNRLRSS